MSNEIVSTTAFKAMQTDIQVSMDDVVSAFVSQYENNLYDRKKQLGNQISDLEKKLKGIVEDVLKQYNGKEYTQHKLPFDLKLKLDNKGTIDWIKGTITHQVVLQTELSGSSYSRSITIIQRKKIAALFIKKHKAITEEISDLRSELGEVLVALKSVTRKERQVRGRIAMRKLEDSGYASLMQDDELIRLVQIDE